MMDEIIDYASVVEDLIVFPWEFISRESFYNECSWVSVVIVGILENKMTTCLCVDGVSVFSGRSHTIRFTLSTVTPPADAVPMDLTDASIWFSVKNSTSDDDSSARVYKRNLDAGGSDLEIKIIDATGGIMEVYITPSDTEDMSEGDYWFDVAVKNSSGVAIEAVSPSRFHVKYTVTKTLT